MTTTYLLKIMTYSMESFINIRNRITVLHIITEPHVALNSMDMYNLTSKCVELIPFNIHQIRCFWQNKDSDQAHGKINFSVLRCTRKGDFLKRGHKRDILKIFRSIILIKWFGVKGSKGTFISPQLLVHDTCTLKIRFSSVQFSCSVVSDSLRLHESQHARPPCPSPTPRVHPNSCPSSRQCRPAISSSVVPFSSCPQSLPASICEQNNKCRIQLLNKVPNTYSTSWADNNPGQINIKCKSWHLLPNSSWLTSSSIPKETHTYLGTEKVKEIYSFLSSQWEKNLRPRFIKSEIKGLINLNF